MHLVFLFSMLPFPLNYYKDFVFILLFIHLVYYFYIPMAIPYLLEVICYFTNSKDFDYNIKIILVTNC
jgi:hypothetical protein